LTYTAANLLEFKHDTESLLLILQQQAHFRYALIGFLLYVICSERPIDLDKPNILASAADTGYCYLLFNAIRTAGVL
jgi:hypothetical protein